jgi:predicted XRE-type DNA-binding protein
MTSKALIAKVLETMAQLDVTQSELATACGLSQPHISKVLSFQVKLAPKTERKLTVWLKAARSEGGISKGEAVHALALRLEALRPTKRMQIMELLKAIERFVET